MNPIVYGLLHSNAFLELNLEVRENYRDLHPEYIERFPQLEYTPEELMVLETNVFYKNEEFKVMCDRLLDRIPELTIDERLLRSHVMGITEVIDMCKDILYRILVPIIDITSDMTEERKALFYINQIVLLSSYIKCNINNFCIKGYIHYVSLMHTFIQHLTKDSIYMKHSFGIYYTFSHFKRPFYRAKK